jgi:hypothetical protein
MVISKEKTIYKPNWRKETEITAVTVDRTKSLIGSIEE